MHTQGWIVVAVLVGLVGWFGRAALSEAETGEDAGGQDMAKVMEELAKPGEMHAWLARCNGAWDVTGEFSEEDGSKTAVEGTARFRMILGDRFSQQDLSIRMGEKPYEGIGITGYDNLKKQFTSYWFDSWSTYTSPGVGQRSAEGRTLTLTGAWDMPGSQVPFKYVYTWADDDHFTFRMFMTWEGQEAEVGTLQYSRKE